MNPRERFRARRSRRRSRTRRRRAVYVLPNLITSASLLVGFWSIVMSTHHHFERAAALIVLAGIFDMLDGRVARATHSTSRFGVEYDSISDMVSFGLAPALLVYNWVLEPLGNRGWLIAALFALCAALRLARYNVQTEGEARVHFVGVPSTIAGGFVASTVFFMTWLEIEPPFPRPIGLIVTTSFALIALLMVSPIPYPSWKMVHISRRHAYPTLVAVVLGGVAMALHYEWMLFACAVVFMLSGPVLWVLRGGRAPQPVREGEAVRPEDGEPESSRDV